MSVAIEVLATSHSLDEKVSFDLSRQCAALIFSDLETDNDLGRKILINLLDNWAKVPRTHHEIWTDLLEAAGFYPYIGISDEKRLASTAQSIRREYHASQNLKSTYFHEEQKELAELIKQGKNVIISAPTSFGKSLLIEDVVASGVYRNIVIIQPTLALLDETRRKLKKYADKYKVIIKTSQEASKSKGNLFLLTAERVMEYPQLPTIDFFIIDEFYKLSAKRDDERSDVLNNAFHLLLGFKAQFYLLGPNIDGISEGFAEKYNAVFKKTNYSLVDNQAIDIYSAHKDKFDHPRKNPGYKEQVLFDLLKSLNEEQTIIYCSSPERVRKLATRFAACIDKSDVLKYESLNLVGWIKENVSSEWGIVDCLEKGIGIHDGALPKHMTSAIISYFNDKRVKYLFCTSTIIEGVNTSAKNIVYFDAKKGGNKKIDYFDYSNIKGRSGRLMVHYVGKVYNFNKPPEKQDVIIDIPFFDQVNASPEVLIHLSDNEVKDKDSKEYQNILAMPELERKIIQKNGLLVRGQQEILEILRRDIRAKPEIVIWSGMPKYEQLTYVIGLAWDHLIKEGESTGLFTKSQITKITFDYGINQDISFLIQNQYAYFKKLTKYQGKTDAEILDEAVRFAFQALRHWFGYKVPKWILTVDHLQKYVAVSSGRRPGDYSFYASQIENDFIRSNLTLLDEYGVPRSAIKKLESFVGEYLEEDQVIAAIESVLERSDHGLTGYELEKIRECL